MRSLLVETLEIMAKHGFAPEHVRWVGSLTGTFVTDWKTFAPLADRKYDEGFGGVEVVQDLTVVGDDWWLERHEYDGSEWWEFKRRPRRMADATWPADADLFHREYPTLLDKDWERE